MPFTEFPSAPAYAGFGQVAYRPPDKEFRYLRTVIVTAAVHQGLDQGHTPSHVTF